MPRPNKAGHNTRAIAWKVKVGLPHGGRKTKRTGESTAAVTTAVRERLDRIRRDQGDNLANRLLAIGKDCAQRLKEPFRSADHDALFYDAEACLDDHRHICARCNPS